MDNMNEWCVKQHGKSGLTEKVLKSDLTMEDCESQVLQFVKDWTPKGKCPLGYGKKCFKSSRQAS